MIQFRGFLVALGFNIVLFFVANTTHAQVQFTGVNLAGAEFGDNNLPGTYNQHYTYPSRAEIDYFTNKGMNIFRLPFRWERLQPIAGGNLNSTELSRIKSFVDYASSKEAHVILDPHNYARYYGEVIGTGELPDSVFGDFWKKVALQFKNYPLVIFGLMNEPHDMDTELWLEAANTAIAAIRSAGAENLILVPGNGWSGAHSWSSSWYGTPNSQVMLNIVDSLDNYAYEVHQYLDSNSSGSSPTCVSTAVGTDRLKSFTGWLRTHEKRGFLGEFGVAANETCLAGTDNMLTYIDENADVWLGWTWWAAGPWWGDYMYSVEPENGQNKPQMVVLEKHVANTTTGSKTLPANKKGFSLFQNFPNPFNESTEIEFHLNETSFVQLNVYNLYGQKVACLANEEVTAGNHKVTWNAHSEEGSRMPGGIYFYSIKINNTNNGMHKKMMLVY